MDSFNLACYPSLKTGAMIMAIYKIMVGLFSVMISVIFFGLGLMDKSGMWTDNGNGTQEDTGVAVATLDDTVSSSVIDTEQQIKLKAALVLILSVIYFAVSAFFFVKSLLAIGLGSVLVHAIRKESSSLMKTWMIFEVMVLILEIAFFSICYFKTSMDMSGAAFYYDLLNLIIGVALVCIVHYIREDMKSNKNYKNIEKEKSLNC